MISMNQCMIFMMKKQTKAREVQIWNKRYIFTRPIIMGPGYLAFEKKKNKKGSPSLSHGLVVYQFQCSS